MVTLGAILVILASQRGPETGVLFRKTTLSWSYGEWFEERSRKEAGKIRKEKMATIQVMDSAIRAPERRNHAVLRMARPLM